LFEDVIYFINFNYTMTFSIIDDNLEVQYIYYDYNKYKEQTDISMYKLPSKNEMKDILINHFK
jgi:hypothetical protein